MKKINSGEKLALGMCLGVAFGTIFDNLALGLCFGTMVGIIWGHSDNNDEENGEEEK